MVTAQKFYQLLNNLVKLEIQLIPILGFKPTIGRFGPENTGWNAFTDVCSLSVTTANGRPLVSIVCTRITALSACNPNGCLERDMLFTFYRQDFSDTHFMDMTYRWFDNMTAELMKVGCDELA